MANQARGADRPALLSLTQWLRPSWRSGALWGVFVRVCVCTVWWCRAVAGPGRARAVTRGPMRCGVAACTGLQHRRAVAPAPVAQVFLCRACCCPVLQLWCTRHFRRLCQPPHCACVQAADAVCSAAPAARSAHENLPLPEMHVLLHRQPDLPCLRPVEPVLENGRVCECWGFLVCRLRANGSRRALSLSVCVVVLRACMRAHQAACSR
jgi:hypothetical protein